ncbi:hypothetical protein CBS63078_4906 [Aspergillus niger]|nr:hypothetical protein CBS115989_9288 [Aspergillus niger]KAI2830654.1 hypothetical protein CBS133816_3372 [Aspergillus niger]KAI2844698.1 hypothetical protein CBS11350_4617 [Aspergillus niger]KAI2858340.1 hypothetical protein CBS11232_2591 [Aspergillus niger]KAI2865816.1 hypothetical protein CBS12448_1735 [Aspergillus niger]
MLGAGTELLSSQTPELSPESLSLDDNTIAFPLSAGCEGSSFRAPVKNSILRLPIGPQKHARRYRSAFRRL